MTMRVKITCLLISSSSLLNIMLTSSEVGEIRAVYRKVRLSSATCANNLKRKAINQMMRAKAILIVRILKGGVENKAKNNNCWRNH